MDNVVGTWAKGRRRPQPLELLLGHPDGLYRRQILEPAHVVAARFTPVTLSNMNLVPPQGCPRRWY